MEIQVLGPLRVVDADGAEVGPRAEQQRRVLALLAVEPSGVSAAGLEMMLWGDAVPSANALQALVSRLRKAIHPATVDSANGRYRLSGAGTDIERFDAALAEGDADAAVALVRGRPLDDVDGDEFLGPRARLSAAVDRARADRLRSIVDGPRPGDAIEELERLVAEQPLAEPLWALLMRAHARAGAQADALRTYQRARSALVEELGVEPGAELREIERSVLEQSSGSEVATSAGSVAPVLPARRRPLPAPLASVVGRREDIERITDGLERHRLVTVVGPGGAGKTTIALEVARTRSDVSVFVELASLDDRFGIARALSTALGLPDVEQPSLAASTPNDPLQRVIEVVGDTETLVVFDNCEHVVEHAAEVASELLAACSGMRMISTSREALSVPGELVLALPPLDDAAAISLLRQRAEERGAGAALADVADDDLGALCARLDGLPLAIELAAARLRTTTLPHLVARLDDRFALLTDGPRTVEPRQQTLRAVVDWSHDLLDDDERVLFRRLAVFAGGADARAVAAVVDGPVDAVLDRLVDKSLLGIDRAADTVRFTMLETLRDYAREQLIAHGELEAVSVRHARHVARALEPALRGLVGADQLRWFAAVRRERQNIDAALDTALAVGDAQLALGVTAPLGWYFFMVGEIVGGREALGAALSMDGDTDPALRALALGLYGWLSANGDDIELALASTIEARSLLDRVDDGWVRAMVRNTHAMALFFSGRLDEVSDELGLLVEAAAESQDDWMVAITQVVQGELAQFTGDIEESKRCYAEAADAFEQIGDRFAYSLTITEASELAEQVGDYDRAVELLERGVGIADEVGFSGHPLAMRARLGNVEILRGRLDDAYRHHRALIDDSLAGGVPWLQAMAHMGLSAVARRRERFEEAARHLDEAWRLPRSRSVPYMRAIILVARGYLADQVGDAATALEHQRAALETTVALGAPRGVAYALEGVAGALALGHDDESHELGAAMLGRADAIRRATGGAMPEAERYDVGRAERRLRRALGDDRFDERFELGAAARDEELIAAVPAARESAATSV